MQNNEEQQLALNKIRDGKNVSIVGSGGCVDADTEFLTKSGWVKFSEYSGQEVAVYNPEDDSMVFENAEYIKLPCEQLTQLSARCLDMVLCDDHRVLYWNGKLPKHQVISFKEVLTRHEKSEVGWAGKIRTAFTHKANVAGIPFSEGELRLQVAVNADGRIVKEGKNNYTQMRFAKKRKYDRLLELCKKFELPFKDNGGKIRSDGRYEYEVIVYPKSRDKRYNQSFYSASSDQLKIIVDEVRYWDSSIEGNTIRFCSKYKEDVDFIQFAFASCGYKTSMRFDERYNKNSYIVNGTVSKHGAYRSYFSDKENKPVPKVYKTKDGYKYCFRVSTGFFVARRSNYIFVTGNCGKSYTIKQLDDGATIFMAPTGIAALNIGGITMHSALGLPIGYPTEDDLASKSKKLTTLFGPNSDIRRIVLDETYMCRADSFDMIDTKLRLVRKVDKPFGGIQMVLTGDPFQLEPIVDDKVKPYLERDYKSPYCFDSNAWHEGEIDMVELRKVMRQSDEQQIALLNSIRTKDENYLESLRKIHEIAKPYEKCINTLQLCAYNQQADKVNYFWYNKLSSQEYTFKGFGNFAPHEVMVDYELKLKVGARVLICANDVENSNYVNGERGIITSILGGDVYVMKDDGVEVLVAPFTWQKYDYEMTLRGLQKKVIAEYTQLPLKLGYAISVHKSQGMSLDDVAIDFGRGSFAAGQTYVALSRIRDLRNLSFVRPLKPEDVIVNRRVKEFYQSIQGTFK